MAKTHKNTKSLFKKRRFKSLTSSLIATTPNTIVKFFKNRFFIFIATLAIGGLIGNRFDQFFSYVVNWNITKQNYPNYILVLLIISILLFLWLLIAYIRLNDMFLYEKSPNNNPAVKIRYSSDDFYKELTSLIVNSKYKSDLFISIGEGESLNDWLIRICGEAEANRIKHPQIQSVYIKMLSPDLGKALESSKYISKGYCSRMNNNINKLIKNSILKKYGIEVNVTYWHTLPPFHGFIYDKHCFINSWEINSNGFLHVRTPLREFTAEQFPEKYNELVKVFKK